MSTDCSRLYWHVGIVLMALGVASSTTAQQAPLRFEHIDSGAGLSHNWVWSLLQDRRGFLWIATLDGLNRYDGYAFVTFKQRCGDGTFPIQDEVSALTEGPTGDLWIGTTTLHRLDRSAGCFVSYDLGIEPRSTINSLAFDAAGMLWIATDAGQLLRYDRQRDTLYAYGLSEDGAVLQRVATATGLTFGYHPLLVDSEGTLWVSAYRAGTTWLYRYNPSADQFQGRALPEALGVVQAMHVGPSGTFWIGGDRVGRLDADQVPLLPGWSADTRVFSLLEDRNGRLWVGTEEGLYRYDPEADTWQHQFLDTSGPATLSNFCGALMEDRAGAVWIGTRNGVYRYDPHLKPFEHLGTDAGLPETPGSSMIMAIDEETPGRLWLGTLGGGLLRVDRPTGQVTSYLHHAHDPTSLPGNNVWALHRDPNDRLWVGTGSGLAMLDPRTGTFTRQPLPGRTASTGVYAIIPDAEGTLWVTGLRDLYRLDPETEHLLAHIDVAALVPNHLTLLLQDVAFTSPHDLWIGTLEVGLFRYDLARQQLTRYPYHVTDTTGLTGKSVFDLYVDSLSTLWMGTDAGLSRLDPETDRFHTYSEASAMPGSVVYSLLEDDRHRLWLGTSRGLVRFDPRTEQFRHFGIADGLGHAEFNRRATFRSPDGTFYFGGLKGLTAFHPDHVEANPYLPPVVLTAIRTTNPDSTVSIRPFGLDHLVLSHRDYLFTVEFAALNFTNAQKNQYAYKLEGFDDDWVHVGALRRATYTSIPPGEYTFRVKAANNDGRWNEEGTSLRLTITPPWWQTRWAYILYVVLGIGAIYGVVAWRSVQLKRRNRTLSRLVAARTAEVERQKTQIEAQAEKLLELDEMKSRFFANLSHEFRTPLTLIRGSVEDVRAERHGPLPARAQAQLDVSLHNTERLQQLIDQLLDLTRLEAGKLTLRAARDDLVAVVRRITSAFASLAEHRGITLAFETDTPEIDLYFDAEKLEQIATNLLSNALKFTPEGGRIAVTVSDAPAGTEEQGVGTFVTLRVADTGTGIPPTVQPHVFERFYQASDAVPRVGEGLGIGLALVKELVELHGGEITVESEGDRGTTFTIALPKGTDHLSEDEIVSEQDVASSVPILRDEAMPSQAEPTPSPEDAAVVLVVEDNAEMRAYLREHLEPAYQVAEAVDGADGLQKAQELQPALVISDVMMPKMDGIALLKALRDEEALATVPVILLTARAAERDRLEGLEARADAYLTKPFNADELEVRVHNLTETRQALRTRYRREVVAVPPSDLDLDPADEVFLEKARDTVETCLGQDDFDVQALADALFVSRRSLERKLKRLTGQTPGVFIRQMRLEHARQLLEQRAVETVSEAAHAVGFSKVSYFSRLYRQAFDQSPADVLADDG